MDEYIKREDAIKMIEDDLPEVVYYRKEDAITCLECCPAADVVPKSEVVCSLDKLMKALQKRQNYCDKEAEKCGYYLERRGEFDGESAGLDYCLEKIAELKKKYTEVET